MVVFGHHQWLCFGTDFAGDGSGERQRGWTIWLLLVELVYSGNDEKRGKERRAFGWWFHVGVEIEQLWLVVVITGRSVVKSDSGSWQKTERDEREMNWRRWFNATEFQLKFKGKRLMFVGDPLSVDQWQSLTCMLHAADPQAEYISARSGATSFFTFPTIVVAVYLRTLLLPAAAEFPLELK
ncbi:hypothetical protein RND71_012843 [Anisodus tanguticus]|uniref:Trichome birefringence-like C-terminal domain-containing protein n=1 Tax=Anisodus tanguticus TaxID=243964 RepID=A0AAE1SHW1_9SOLA|nr:hypothetical protein RND71_012843 [Anisodus tanguticus]